MAKEKDGSISTIQAAIIGGIATIVGAIITILPQDNNSNLPKPSVAIDNNNKDISSNEPLFREKVKSKNNLRDTDFPNPKKIKSPKRINHEQSQSNIKALPTEDKSVNSLTSSQSSTNDISDQIIKKPCSSVRSDNDADVAFYADPTDNTQPKGYINSGSEVIILRSSVDDKMLKIQTGNRYGWIPREKVFPCN